MRKAVWIILFLLAVILTACSRKPDGGGNEIPGKREFPEDIAITAFKLNERSTAMLPYYIVREEADGWHWYVTMDENEPTKGYMCSNTVTDKDAVEAFFRELVDAGILKWDGYSKSRSRGPGVLDGDSGFTLELSLSDGSILTASGYNIYPENFKEINQIVRNYFSLHEDYSEYYPIEWPEEKLEMIKIEIGSPYTSPSSRMLKIELTPGRKQWSVVLKDPYGKYYEKGSEVSDYGNTEEDLPVEDYAELLRKHNILAMNSQTGNPETDAGLEYLNIYGYFDGQSDKMIEIRKSISMEEYDEFIREFVEMTKQYYCKVKQ